MLFPPLYALLGGPLAAAGLVCGCLHWQHKPTRSSAIAVMADRTPCSILTLFIVSTTSRPLSKKSVCCQCANPINNYCASASANSQFAHLFARAVGTGPRRSHRTAQCRLAALERPNCVLGLRFVARAVRFFVVHFVAKRYILQQKCHKGQIGTCMLGARWYNF